jgi:hypothetical protein
MSQKIRIIRALANPTRAKKKRTKARRRPARTRAKKRERRCRPGAHGYVVQAQLHNGTIGYLSMAKHRWIKSVRGATRYSTLKSARERCERTIGEGHRNIVWVQPVPCL